MPAYRRFDLTRVCLRQLRRTCDELIANGIDATAVVVADDENLDTASDLGFGTVYRDNRALGKRFNDALQVACDPRHNPWPAQFAVPIGSDDFVDWRIFLDLPRNNQVRAFQKLSFVNQDGTEIRSAFARNLAGCGIRVYPAQVLERAGFRPAEEYRQRACDTSILTTLAGCYERDGAQLVVTYGDQHDLQVVDFKSSDVQINPYDGIVTKLRAGKAQDPFQALADIYPPEALDDLRAHYSRELVFA